ncbi:MAG: cell wall hydrolase [Rhizobiaceae bacterium]
MKKSATAIIGALILVIALNSVSRAAPFFVATFTYASVKSVLSSSVTRADDELETILGRHCLALAIYHEARGESVWGQHAVAAAILNRVRSTAYPNTICGVVYQNAHRLHRCQFSFACDKLSDVPANYFAFKKSNRIADMVLSGSLAREAKFVGASYTRTLDVITHYHRHDINPVWSSKLQRLSNIGNHVFLKSERVTSRYRDTAL